MACDPNTLLDQAKCFNCNLSGDMFMAIEIVLLCKIRDGETSSCDPATLIAEATCIRCNIPPGALSAVKVALLCQIAGL